MSIIDTLITDRTEANLAELEAMLSKPLSAWTAEELSWFHEAKSKGAYNYTDLNRVTAAMQYLDDLFALYGYITGYEPVSVADGRTEWTEQDDPTPETFAAYLLNVEKLRSVLEMPQTTPDTPAEMDGMTIREANAIEQILTDIDVLLTIMATTFIPCGEALCGEDNL